MLIQTVCPVCHARRNFCEPRCCSRAPEAARAPNYPLDASYDGFTGGWTTFPVLGAKASLHGEGPLGLGGAAPLHGCFKHVPCRRRLARRRPAYVAAYKRQLRTSPHNIIPDHCVLITRQRRCWREELCHARIRVTVRAFDRHVRPRLV